MLSKIYDHLSTYWSLQPEGREQRKCLAEKFQECTTAQVNENEFKLKLAKTTWFKDDKFKNNPYLQPDSDSTVFISLDQAFINVANILGWDDAKKAKIAKKNIIRELCFRCPSTKVQTSEYKALIIATGYFGQQITSADYVPARHEAPPFIGLDVFLNNTPDELAWSQVQTLYHDFHKFEERELLLDEMFSGLQHQQYKKLKKKDRAKTDGVQKNQIAILEVPFATFIRAFTKQICPLDLKNPQNSDPFWNTTIGQQWQLKADNEDTDTIDWKTVYLGFKAICPTVLPLSQISANNIANATNFESSVDVPVENVNTNNTSTSSTKSSGALDSIKKHYASILKSKQPGSNNTQFTTQNAQNLLQTAQLINNQVEDPNKKTVFNTVIQDAQQLFCPVQLPTNNTTNTTNSNTFNQIVRDVQSVICPAPTTTTTTTTTSTAGKSKFTTQNANVLLQNAQIINNQVENPNNDPTKQTHVQKWENEARNVFCPVQLPPLTNNSTVVQTVMHDIQNVICPDSTVNQQPPETISYFRRIKNPGFSLYKPFGKSYRN